MSHRFDILTRRRCRRTKRKVREALSRVGFVRRKNKGRDRKLPTPSAPTRKASSQSTHVHVPRPNTARYAVALFLLRALYAVIDPTYAVEAIPGEYSLPKFMDVSRRRGHHARLDLRSFLDQPYNGELPSFVRQRRDRPVVSSAFSGPPIFRRPNDTQARTRYRTMHRPRTGCLRNSRSDVCSETFREEFRQRAFAVQSNYHPAHRGISLVRHFGCNSVSASESRDSVCNRLCIL